MIPVEIDFSGRSRLWVLNTKRKLDRLWILLLVLAVVALAFIIGAALHLEAQAERLSEAARHIELTEQAREARLAPSLPAMSPEALSIINSAIKQLNFPWAELLRGLEKNARQSVRLLSVETGPLRQGTRIVLEADSIDEALAYLGDIKQSPLFARASLVKQERSGSGDQQGDLRFTLEVPNASYSVAEAGSGDQ